MARGRAPFQTWPDPPGGSRSAQVLSIPVIDAFEKSVRLREEIMAPLKIQLRTAVHQTEQGMGTSVRLWRHWAFSVLDHDNYSVEFAEAALRVLVLKKVELRRRKKRESERRLTYAIHATQNLVEGLRQIRSKPSEREAS